MGAAEWVAASVGLALAAVGVIPVLRRRALRSRIVSKTQQLRVRVNGGYVPDRIVVRAGVPVRLIFHREETAPCSEWVVFPDFGTSAMLPPHRDVVVDLPASEPGEHEFTCHMGLLHGLMVVAAAEGKPPREWSRTTSRRPGRHGR